MSTDRKPAPAASRQNAYRSARRHSSAVSFLKRALPIAALTVVGGFTAAAVLSGAFEAETRTAKTSTVTEGEVVMANPRLDGLDRNNRPFALKADAARQKADKPAVVALDTIDAKLPTGAESFASIDATAGIYDTKAETLTLSKGVEVRDLKGMDMDLKSARVDMKGGTLKSDKPVAVRSRNAAIDAQSMEVLESGKRIKFRDRVRMVIHNDSAIKATTKAELLGASGSSTAPWIHTSKLSIEKFVVPSSAPTVKKGEKVISIRGSN